MRSVSLEHLEAVLALLNKPLRVPTRRQLVHGTEHYAHMTYCGLVFIEGHAWYSYAAGVLFVVAVAGLFMQEGH